MPEDRNADSDQKDSNYNAVSSPLSTPAVPTPHPDEPRCQEVKKCPCAEKKERSKWGHNPDSWMVILTALLMVVGIYTAWVFHRQFCEMQKQTEVTINVESPEVYVHGISLVEKRDGKTECPAPETDPITGEETHTVKLVENKDSYVVVVDVENLGKRTAIIENYAIEIVDDTTVTKDLRSEPQYLNKRTRGAPIYPNGEKIKLQRLCREVSINKRDIPAIIDGSKVLWIYGFIDMDVFPDTSMFAGRKQKIGFCNHWWREGNREGFSGNNESIGPLCPPQYEYQRTRSK
jgi:hypothetical protein